MRFWLLSALVAVGIAQAESHHGSNGRLELKDCAAAKAWRASAVLPQQGDSAQLLSAAYVCAQSGEREEAEALQALADALPRDDYLLGTGGNFTRVRIALALGDVVRAGDWLLSTSETLLGNWAKLDDPMSQMLVAHAMQSLNNDIAMKMRASDPARAVIHQLLAARAHDLPDVGTPGMAALYRNVALEIAIKAQLAEPLISASSAILARSASDLTAREAQGITIAALELFDQRRTDDALALANRLKASGQPDAVHGADQVIRHIAQQR